VPIRCPFGSWSSRSQRQVATIASTKIRHSHSNGDYASPTVPAAGRQTITSNTADPSAARRRVHSSCARVIEGCEGTHPCERFRRVGAQSRACSQRRPPVCLARTRSKEMSRGLLTLLAGAGWSTPSRATYSVAAVRQRVFAPFAVRPATSCGRGLRLRSSSPLRSRSAASSPPAPPAQVSSRLAAPRSSRQRRAPASRATAPRTSPS
jgi:hypothetical protein